MNDDASFVLVADSCNNAIRSIALPLPTSSPTPSTTQSSSITPSLTRTGSESPTQSLSVTLSQSQSQTQSLSSPAADVLSNSNDPYTLHYSIGNVWISSATVSDSTPLAAVTLWLNRCPNGGTAQIQRSVTSCATKASQSQDSPTSFSAVQGISTTTSVCDPTLIDFAQVPISLFIGAFFGTVGGSLVVTCNVTDPRVALRLASSALPLTVLPTLWPFWDDAIFVTSAGLMQSLCHFRASICSSIRPAPCSRR